MIVVPPGGAVPLDRDSYCSAGDIPHPSSGHVARRWTYRGMIRSVMFRSGAVAKVREPFNRRNSVLHDAELAALADEAEAGGAKHPSSYASLFHASFKAPRVRRSLQHIFAGAVPGGWHQDIIGTTRVTDPLWQYDINSAYLWSAMQGLPDPASMVIVKGYAGPGVYWVQSPAMTGLPFPWKHPGVFPATSEEIEAFALRRLVIGKGVAFTPGGFDVERIGQAVAKWSVAKDVSRAFWGRWGARTGPRQQTFDRHGHVRTDREMGTLWRLPVWAALVTSRLRLRLWDECHKGSVHLVMTDAVVTSREMPTGNGVGDWREAGFWSHGGIIRPNRVEPFPAYH